MGTKWRYGNHERTGSTGLPKPNFNSDSHHQTVLCASVSSSSHETIASLDSTSVLAQLCHRKAMLATRGLLRLFWTMPRRASLRSPQNPELTFNLGCPTPIMMGSSPDVSCLSLRPKVLVRIIKAPSSPEDGCHPPLTLKVSFIRFPPPFPQIFERFLLTKNICSPARHVGGKIRPDGLEHSG